MEDQHSKIPRVSKNPKIQKFQPKFRIFGNSREPQNPKIQNSSSFQKSEHPKLPTQVSDFWKLEREPQNPKFVLPLEFPKIQTLGWVFRIFGFSETRAGASKSKIRAPARVSKNPNLGVDSLDFWIFGNSRIFGLLDFEAPARVSKNPKLGLEVLDLGIFGNLRNFGFLDFEAPARVSKNPKLGLEILDFGIFGNSRNFGFLDFEDPARVSKNLKLGLEFLDGILETRAGARILDFEAPARVSKNPKLGLDFLGFWNFGNWSFGKICSGVLHGLGFRVQCLGFRV